MNTNVENSTVSEAPANISTEETVSQKFKKIDILIFIACILLAFILWCYASNLADPVVEMDIPVYFVLENGQPDEVLTEPFSKFTFYGKQSDLQEIGVVTIYVDRSQFSEYDVETLIEINYRSNFNSETKTVKLTLTLNKSEQ